MDCKRCGKVFHNGWKVVQHMKKGPLACRLWWSQQGSLDVEEVKKSREQDSRTAARLEAKGLHPSGKAF
eukprot:1019808-Prorocentrum_lima.AAC.1